LTIKIGDLDLSSVKGDLSTGQRSQTTSVKKIASLDKRRIIKYDSSAVYGTIIKDHGRISARIMIEGQFMGEESTQGMSTLRRKYKLGEPVSLVSDLTLLSGINKVMIEDLQIQISTSVQMSYDYQMILREYVETDKKQSNPPPSQKGVALSNVNSQASSALQKLKQVESGVLIPESIPESILSAAKDLPELKQDVSTVTQKAQSLKERGEGAIALAKSIVDNKSTPSQRAQALTEVATQAKQALDEVKEI
jgi:hypothetical protein